MARTRSPSICPPAAWAIAWSSSESASRTEPSAARTIWRSASSAASTPSRAATAARCSNRVSPSTRRRSKRWQRDSTVTGTRRISVVAENELHMLGRLFERLQQRVEGVARQHVHFVDDVDLETRRDRAVAHPLDQLADVVDPGAAGRVHLDHVDMAILADRGAVLAGAAGIGRRPAAAVGPDAVQRPRDDPGGGGLSDAADAGQDEGMRQPARGDRVGERPHRRVLADEVGEAARSVGAREHPVGPGFPMSRSCLAQTVLPCRRCHTMGDRSKQRKAGTRPGAFSLRLLPSGPDRVGERSVRNRPPNPLYQRSKLRATERCGSLPAVRKDPALLR